MMGGKADGQTGRDGRAAAGVKLSKTTFLTEVQLLSKVTLDPGKSCSFYDTLGEQLKSLPELIHFLK